MLTVRTLVVEPSIDTAFRRFLASGISAALTEHGRAARISTAHQLAIVHAPPGEVTAALEAVRAIRARDSQVPIVLVVAESSEETAIAALNAGVTRYLREPVLLDALIAAVQDVTLRRTPAAPATDDVELQGGDRLVGESSAVCGLRAYIKRVARSSTNVLITGETGTGKELVAELIQRNSSRAQKPFVSLNCTAIPETLFESELFGYERGAFTGAYAGNAGKLAAASTGTVFLDEIGDISAAAQAKLLRALEGKQIYRLGSGKPVPLDVRVLAATNQNLEAALEEKRFRRDLYYRLNVVRIELPPLRDRVEDIPTLLAHFVAPLNRTFGMAVNGFTRAASDTLLNYPWPGNVRELKNMLEAVFVNLPERAHGLIDLPQPVLQMLTRLASAAADERQRILRVLVATNWNKTRAARQLAWSRMTLYRKMARYHVVAGRPEIA